MTLPVRPETAPSLATPLGAAAALGSVVVLVAAIALGAAAAGAEEGELAAGLATCRMTEDPTERLRCYDALAGAEAKAGVAEEAAVLALAGADDFDSEGFVVEEPWHLRWDSGGSILTVELREAGGELIDIIGNQIGRGEGRSTAQRPGSYSLAVRAIGDWRLWVMGEP